MSKRVNCFAETAHDIRQRIFSHIESIRADGKILKLPDVVSYCDVSRHIAREYVVEYTESVLNTLMEQKVESQSDFDTWCETFRCFRNHLERKNNYQALRLKHIDYAIYFLTLKGEFTASSLKKVVGGLASQWRERVRNFEHEHGLELNPRQNWKKKLFKWDKTDNSYTKETLYHYLHECQKNRTPVKMADLVRHTKRSQPTLSKAIQPYLDNVASELNNKIASTAEEIQH